MQIVFFGDNLHEMSNLILKEAIYMPGTSIVSGKNKKTSSKCCLLKCLANMLSDKARKYAVGDVTDFYFLWFFKFTSRTIKSH